MSLLKLLEIGAEGDYGVWYLTEERRGPDRWMVFKSDTGFEFGVPLGELFSSLELPTSHFDAIWIEKALQALSQKLQDECGVRMKVVQAAIVNDLEENNYPIELIVEYLPLEEGVSDEFRVYQAQIATVEGKIRLNDASGTFSVIIETPNGCVWTRYHTSAVLKYLADMGLTDLRVIVDATYNHVARKTNLPNFWVIALKKHVAIPAFS